MNTCKFSCTVLLNAQTDYPRRNIGETVLGKCVLHCRRNRYSSYEINHYVEIDYVKIVTGKKMKQKSIKTENNAHDQKGNLKKLGTRFNRSTNLSIMYRCSAGRPSRRLESHQPDDLPSTGNQMTLCYLCPQYDWLWLPTTTNQKGFTDILICVMKQSGGCTPLAPLLPHTTPTHNLDLTHHVNSQHPYSPWTLLLTTVDPLTIGSHIL